MNPNMSDYLRLFREYNQAMEMYGPHSLEAQNVQYKLDQLWKDLSEEDKLIIAKNGARL